MKNSLIILSLLLSFAATAKDMSRTEHWEDVYKELEDGSVAYVGACSVHGDKNMTIATQTLVEYFEPSYEMTRPEFLAAVKPLEMELITAMESQGILSNLPEGIDDFYAEKIQHTTIKGLDLYLLNIGVGGGNGMILVFNRTVKNGRPVYEFMSEVFDGDIEYCDSKVWLTK